MPRLLTSTSSSGNARIVASAPSAVPLSDTTDAKSPFGTSSRRPASAASTVSGLRPLTATVAPSPASEAAIARPIPPVEAVTSARLPARPRSTDSGRRFLEALEVGQPVGHELVAAGRQVAPDARGRTHGRRHLREGLEADQPVVGDAVEPAHHGLPVHHAASGDAAVALAEVEVPEPVADPADGGLEPLFLDVHVVRVEVDADVVLADHLGELDRLVGGVDEEHLVAVARLDPERHAEFGGVAGGGGPHPPRA